MAIYRESSSSRRLLPIVAAVAITLVLIVAVIVLLSRANSSATGVQPAADNSPSATAALDKISTSLDLFQIEYDKVVAGTAASQTGAPGAITTAINTLNAASNLSKLNKLVYSDLQTDLNTLNSALHTSPALDIKKIVADAQKQLQTLTSLAALPATAAH